MIWNLAIYNDPEYFQLKELMKDMNLELTDNSCKQGSKINFTYLKKQYCTLDPHLIENGESVCDSFVQNEYLRNK